MNMIAGAVSAMERKRCSLSQQFRFEPSPNFQFVVSTVVGCLQLRGPLGHPIFQIRPEAGQFEVVFSLANNSWR
jgi:hypothetical protein